MNSIVESTSEDLVYSHPLISVMSAFHRTDENAGYWRVKDSSNGHPRAVVSSNGTLVPHSDLADLGHGLLSVPPIIQPTSVCTVYRIPGLHTRALFKLMHAFIASIMMSSNSCDVKSVIVDSLGATFFSGIARHYSWSYCEFIQCCFDMILPLRFDQMELTRFVNLGYGLPSHSTLKFSVWKAQPDEVQTPRWCDLISRFVTMGFPVPSDLFDKWAHRSMFFHVECEANTVRHRYINDDGSHSDCVFGLPGSIYQDTLTDQSKMIQWCAQMQFEWEMEVFRQVRAFVIAAQGMFPYELMLTLASAMLRHAGLTHIERSMRFYSKAVMSDEMKHVVRFLYLNAEVPESSIEYAHRYSDEYAVRPTKIARFK